jgi:VWFA-related protein
MRNKRAAVTQAALNFVKASNPDDRVFIVNFDTDAWIDQDFTNSIPKMREALDRIDSHGGTALYDAVTAAADYVVKQPNVEKKLEKKVLLVVTDGWDNASLQSLEQAVRKLQVENGPTIYTIGILDEDAKKKGRRALRELAEQTGGVAYFPKDLAEVDTISQEVARDIRSQYTIGFKKNPGEAPGYRSIKVAARADGYKNLTVRTRSGYFQGEEKTAKR